MKLEETAKQRGAKAPCKMGSPFAPIETRLAKGPPCRFEGSHIYAKSMDLALAARRHPDRAVLKLDHLPRGKARKEFDAAFAGKMIVTDARLAHLAFFRSRARSMRLRILGKVHQGLDGGCHFGAGQPVVSVTALLLDREKAPGQQLGQVTACGWRRDSANPGKLAGCPSLSAHQGGEHVRAGWVADKRRKSRDVRTILHTAIVHHETGNCFGREQNIADGPSAKRRCHPLESSIMITCIIRYQIYPTKKARFEHYARNWGQAIPRCGADLIGYFAPHEGSATLAYGIYSVESLAAYERYRSRLTADPIGRENFEFAARERFILREDRTFLKLASAPHANVVRYSGQEDRT
jgi:hypothetical protein